MALRRAALEARVAELEERLDRFFSQNLRVSAWLVTVQTGTNARQHNGLRKNLAFFSTMRQNVVERVLDRIGCFLCNDARR